MKIFSTLFDAGYISRGFQLYNSLVRSCQNEFRLYVLALDDKVKSFFSELNDNRIVIIRLDEVKQSYEVLSKLQKERTRAEFCWTLASFFVQYVLNHFDVDSCIYVDADVYFFSDPQYLLDLMGNESVLITEHNYTPEYDKTAQSGKFCVQFNYFKNNERAAKVLEWWRSKCEEACTVDLDKGLCGDQKYLDDWESRFQGDVFNCRSLGCVAPWNVQKVDLVVEDGQYFVCDKVSKVKEPLVFYHFHLLKRLRDNVWRIPGYIIDEKIYDHIYGEYVGRMQRTESVYNDISIESEKEAELIDMGLFFPVPFLDKKTIDKCSFCNVGVDRCIDVEDNFGNTGRVLYHVCESLGRYVVINGIEGRFVFSHFHEVLWEIQRLECYSNCNSIYNVIKEIAIRAGKNERIRTECPMYLFDGSLVVHPAYEVKSYYRCVSCNGDERYIQKKLTRTFK